MLRRFSRVVVLLAACASVSACSSKNDCAPKVVTSNQSCKTTQDCIDAGYKGLSCLNATCGRPCTADQDCVLSTDSDPAACKDTSATAPVFICEAELCAVGCPDAPCATGEQCVNGRCTIFFEGFELPAGKDLVTPATLGWNDLPAPMGQTLLENQKTEIVFTGHEGCVLGDDRCAGPASQGVRFLALERMPTPAIGTPSTDFTCRACACCLECRLNPPANGRLSEIPTCPGAIDPPLERACTSATPDVCQPICAACDQCPNATARQSGEGLLTCEAEAAVKGCAGCEAYQRCVTEALAAHDCESASEPCHAEANCRACVVSTCDPLRGGCFACSDAAQCEIDTPGSAACRTLQDTCDAQGNQGCYDTPIVRRRSQLTDQEQSLTSPKIPGVAGLTGRLVLELEYVPFDIREKYRRVIQGQPSSSWPVEDQEVAVQLCPGSCEQPSSWVDGQLTGGGRAAFPPAGQRNNGLSFSAQSSIDWRSNRLEVDIPEMLRTADFRFRFLPRLDDDAQIGIDNVKVRRR